jgi:hypothetical protein
MRRRGIAFVLTLGLLVPRVCLADEPNATQIEAARRLYQQALEDEKRGEYRQAIDKLQRASTVKTTAASRYHLGLCEEKLGHLVAALAYYQAAEQQAQAEGKKEVSELVREPLSRLSERVPRLTVRVRRPEPPGLEVLLDGKPLAPGLYDVEVRIDVGSPGPRPWQLSGDTRCPRGQQRQHRDSPRKTSYARRSRRSDTACRRNQAGPNFRRRSLRK